MNIKRSIVNYIINFILALFMSFSFIYAITATLGFEYSPLYIITVISCLILIYSLIFFNKLALKISGLIIITALSGAVFYFIYNHGFSELSGFFGSFFDWIYNFIVLQKRIINPSYSFILTLAVCSLLTLFTFFFTVKKFKFIYILIFGIVLFVWQWSFQYLVSYISFYLFVFLILVYYFRHIYAANSSKEANEYVYPSLFTIFVIPVCAVIILLSFLIPAKPKPLEWKWLDGKINHLYSYMVHGGHVSKFDYFSVGVSGFGGNDGELGGKVQRDKTLVLKVNAPRPVYLKGAIKDFYTGTSWKETDSSLYHSLPSKYLNYDDLLRNTMYDNYSSVKEYGFNRSFMDYTEMLAGMSMLTNDTDFIRKYFFEDTIKITYNNLLTKSIFFSNGIYKLSAGSSNLLGKTNGIILSKERKGKNYSYSFNAYTLKTGDNDLQDILRKSYKGFYNDYYNNINALVNDLLIASEEVCADTELPYRILDKFGFKFLVYAKSFTEDIPENAREILDEYNISATNEIVTDYVLTRKYGNSAFMVPLDNTSKNLLNFNILYKGFKNMQFNELIQNVLKTNSDEAYSKYLQLPDTLPERVKDLAESISASYKNQYDKVKAVEKYLSSNYAYTLSPKSTPKGRDFVDYFLFDLKEGYCTYYATSMVVMLRSIGIPARYVEGYALSSKPKKGTVYDVTNEKAHAWVEVYFEGFGWLPFEPTASFDESFYDNRKTSESSNGFDPFSGDSEKGRAPSSVTKGDGDGQADAGSADKKNYMWFILLVAIFLILLILFVLVSANTIKGYLRISKFRKLPPRESIIASYNYYLNMLSLAGLAILPGETPFIYSGRVDRSLLSSTTSFQSITEIFVLARYSQNTLDEKEKDCVNLYLYELSEKVKGEMGVVKYIIYKLILGKI